MELSELETLTRKLLGDEVQPFLWSSPDLRAFLNDAQAEAAARTGHIEDVVSIALNANKSKYTLPASVTAILDARIDQRELVRGKNMLDLRQGQFYDTDTNALWVYEGATGTLKLRVKRLPTEMESGGDEPEIHPRHHGNLIYWAARCAYMRPDTETHDVNAAERNEQIFTSYFGERSDANVQRKQRADVAPCVRYQE